MARLAWFSPMPPDRSGVAVYGSDLVSALRHRHEVDVYVDEPIAAAYRRAPPAERPTGVHSAHEFVWRRRLTDRPPYDLAVYQLGNSASHDFLWPYLFRFPGLVVLHDAHLHHARAAALLRERRITDYREEFAAAHPSAARDLAELAVTGFHNHLLYEWPMTSLVVQASRITAVHAPLVADALRAECPHAAVDTIRIGHGERVDAERACRSRGAIRARYGIAGDAVVFGVFGGLTPEKRVPQVLEAFAYLLAWHPDARLMLVGAAASHYDVRADVFGRQLGESATVTGPLSDEDFTDHLLACDVVVNLRWPTAREMSGPWLRALAAGLPTITVDLAHTADVPALDPRSWTVNHTAGPGAPVDPVTVAIDILDEDHSLRLAMRRLAADRELRAGLASAAVKYWDARHAPERMIEDYERLIQRAIGTPDPHPALPAHLTSDGLERLRVLLSPFGLDPWGG